MSDSILKGEISEELSKGENSKLWSGNLHQTFYWISITAAVINIIFGLIAGVENGVLLCVLLKKKHRQVPSNVLLCNLVLADLLTGLVVQPLYSTHIMLDLKNETDFPVFLTFSYSAYFLCGVSLLTVGGMSLDRLFATIYPLQYRVRARWNTFAIFLAFIWVQSIILITIYALQIIGSIDLFGRVCFLGVVIFAIVAFFVSYVWIVRTVGKRNKILQTDLSVSTSSSGGDRTGSRQNKVTKSFAILAIFLCFMYFPMILVKVFLWSTEGHTFRILALVNRATNTITFLNSAVNPIIYCYRHLNIRREVLQLLDKLFSWRTVFKCTNRYH